MTGRSFRLILFMIFMCVMAVAAFPEISSAQDASSYLLTPPCIGRPTQSSVTINLAAKENPVICRIRFGAREAKGDDKWQVSRENEIAGKGAAEFRLDGLKADTAYDYEVQARQKDEKEFRAILSAGFRTQPDKPKPFSFAISTDSHLTPFHQDRFDIMRAASGSILKRQPDLMLMLGDNFQTFHAHGGPMGAKDEGPMLYTILRAALGMTAANVPMFMVNGNWEGENGWHPAEARGWAREARMAFLPNPDDKTYPEGGSPNQDYYAFTWGEALFVAINVTGYTPNDHALGSTVGKADDWTLGEKQKTWLKKVLQESNAKWKFIFSHHTVGGAAGDDMNSRYGRGGGRAAKVGEQATIHEWMKQYGVQAFFYGHDHVFTDIPVDGIHYICAGGAGAPWKFGTAETGYDKYFPQYGYTRVQVEGDRATVSYVSIEEGLPEGKVVHSFAIQRK